MTRQYPKRPIFGVGAIIFERGKVLLVKRARDPLKGKWSLPGGAQKPGETVAEALARETLEETGLEIRVKRFAAMIDIIDRDETGKMRHHYTVADYVCSPTSGALKPGGDAADARWVPVKDLADYDLTPKAREVIEAAWKS